MSKFREFRCRIASLFSGQRFEKELDEEMRAHLDQLIEDNIKSGMTQPEALRTANLKFGGFAQTREAYRDQRRFHLIDSTWRDISYGSRMLLRNPGFSIIAVLTLAIGIGANTAIFSVVNAVLLHSFPYKEPDRLVLLSETRRDVSMLSLSYPDFLDWRSQSTLLESIGGVRRWTPNLTGGGEPERLQAAMVTSGIFETLGIAPLEGRFFGDDEDRPGANPVVVLSHGFWQRRFNSSANVIGTTVTLDRKLYTIVGIMPPRFEFWTADLWVPLGLIGKEIYRRDVHPGIYAIGRLSQGRTISDLRSELASIASRLEEQYPATNSQIESAAVFWQDSVGQDLRPALLMLFGAVMLVLLIACVNLASLQLSRVTGRNRELAIRSALGATRWSLMRQLLVESILLSVLGGALAIVIVTLSLHALVSMIPANSFTAETRFTVDVRVLIFTATISIAAGALFGLAPAFQASRSNVNNLLKGAMTRSNRRRRSPKLRDFLIAAEVGIALLLVLGAALLVKSFVHLHRVDFGFDSNRMLTFGINLPELSRDVVRSTNYIESIVQRVNELPGVESASAAVALPIVRMPTDSPTTLLDRPIPQRIEDVPIFQTNTVSPNFFNTLHIPLIRGRLPSLSDNGENAMVAVINRKAAQQFWPDGDPIGNTVALGPPEQLVEGAIPKGFQFARAQIVGVVGDVRYDSLNSRMAPQLYVTFEQSAASKGPMLWGAIRFAVRCDGDPMTFVPAVRDAVWAINRDQPVSNISTMETLYSESIEQPRMASMLMLVLALLAAALAAIGIYGVISYSVNERRKEIGIRIAIGADSASILRLVVGRVMTFVLLGIAVGIAVSFELGKTIEALMYGTSAADPIIWISASVVLVLVGSLACWLPARRATRIDPIASLRCD